MLLARVMGTVVATRKDPRLEGKKLLICRPMDPDGNDEKSRRFVEAFLTFGPLQCMKPGHCREGESC